MLFVTMRFLQPVLSDSDVGAGAGEEYLEMTETKWDGKTPWFTGSSRPIGNNVRIQLFFKLVNAMVGPLGVSLVRSFFGQLDEGVDVCNVKETGVCIKQNICVIDVSFTSEMGHNVKDVKRITLFPQSQISLVVKHVILVIAILTVS